MRLCSIAWSLWFLLPTLSPNTAAQVPLAAGKKVVTKRPTPIKSSEQTADPGTVFSVYTIERVQGTRLWIASDTVAGWVEADSVVPLEDAVPYFTRELKTNRSHWIYNRRGLILLSEKKVELAIQDFNEAIRLNPDYALAYNNRGLAWSELKDYDRAISDYDEAIRLERDSAVMHRNRGLAQAARGEHDKAIADFTEALRLNPKSPFAHNSRGNAWAAKEAYDKALVDYELALRLDPKNSWAHNNLAWLRSTCPDRRYRDGKKAVRAAQRACELCDWKEPYHLGTLAAACAEAGDFPSAVRWQKKMLEMLPKDDSQYESARARLRLYQNHKPYRLPLSKLVSR
jgi:tetratricopeptide (TPR) repeat protein